MDSLKDLLLKKADTIDLTAKKSQFEIVQSVMDRHFKGEVVVQKIHGGRLTLKVSSASLASNVRLAQVRLLEELGRLDIPKFERLVIRH